MNQLHFNLLVTTIGVIFFIFQFFALLKTYKEFLIIRVRGLFIIWQVTMLIIFSYTIVKIFFPDFILYLKICMVYYAIAYIITPSAYVYKIFVKKGYRNISQTVLMATAFISSIYQFILILIDVNYINIPFLQNNLIGLVPVLQLFSFALSSDFTREHKELVALKNTLSRKIKERTEMLEASNKNKVNYFVNLAHETRTPLTLICNYLDQYIKKTGITEETAIIKQNVEKLRNDMINFLDAQKLERNQVFYNHTDICNLSEIINNKYLIFNKTALKKNITINTVITDNLYIKADPAALDRIINNLLDNAVKYTDNNGSIELALSAEESKLKLQVKDTGIGIDEKQIKHIFSPYHQISHEKRNIQGIGMGLHITRMIVESLHGRIMVETKPSMGTTFTVLLPGYIPRQNERITSDIPLSQPVSPIPMPHNLVECSYDADKKTILLVEDNIQLLSYLKNHLEPDYNIYFGQNGREALEKLETITKPDVIISDIMMDVMDGYTLFDHISKNEKFIDIPFIFLTAKTTITDKITALSRGAIDYIFKPFNIKELKAKVSALLKNKQLKQALVEKDKFVTLGMLTGGLCHEIANPLNLVYGPLDLLELELKKLNVMEHKDIALYLNRITTNVKRIERIIESMKLFTHQKALKKETIDIKRIIESITEIFHNKVKDRITIETIIDDTIEITGDHDAVSHILINLVSNAIDAISDKGTITISLTYSAQNKVLKVKDTGTGINEKILPDIFHAFYTSKGVGKGTGLGLYIVKDLIAKLDWHIDVRSQPGLKTEFIITIG